MSVFIERSAKVIWVSTASEQMCNWCWDSPGVPWVSTLCLSPPHGHWGGWCAPSSLPPHIRGQHRVKNKKTKRDKRYPRRRIRFDFGLFSHLLCFISPCWFNCLPHVSKLASGFQGEGCVDDVLFCFLIFMDVTREWQISGNARQHLLKVALSLLARTWVEKVTCVCCVSNLKLAFN